MLHRKYFSLLFYIEGYSKTIFFFDIFSIPKVGIWFEYYNTWVHELVEVITDPSLGTAWYSAVDSKSGEVSELMDICENNFHGKLGFNKINYNVDVTVNGNSYNWLLQSLYNPTTGLCEWPCTNNACV